MKYHRKPKDAQTVEAVRLVSDIPSPATSAYTALAGNWLVVEGTDQRFMTDEAFRAEFEAIPAARNTPSTEPCSNRPGCDCGECLERRWRDRMKLASPDFRDVPQAQFEAAKAVAEDLKLYAKSLKCGDGKVIHYGDGWP